MSASPSIGHLAKNPRRSGVKWSAAAGIVVLVAAGLFLSNSRARSLVVDDGIALTRAEAALGSTDLALKALGQAVLLAEDRALGVADVATVTLALNEADSTLDELAAAIAELTEAIGSGSGATGAGPVAITSGRRVIELIRASEIDEAGFTLAGPTVAEFEVLRDSVSSVRDERELALTSTGATASRLGDLVRFLVAFVLPLGAVLAYRFAARRQLRDAEVHLDARLEAEREVVRAKGEFIGNISHELRTPLTSIFGFSELLLETGVVDPSAAMDLIGLINHESAELGRMVEDLLVSARVESNALVYKFEEVSLAEELDAVLSSMRHDGPDVDVLVTDTQAWCDPVRVRQILRNLLSNAHRYGGPNIRVTATQVGDMLVTSIADNGRGVPEEMEPRLFTKFVHDGREALETGSVGLGLSVVSSLAADMEGDVSYEHTDGWTRFAFRLPVENSKSPQQGDDRDAEEAAVESAFLTNWREQPGSHPIRSGGVNDR